MVLKFFFLILFGFSSLASAQPDLSLGATFRTYPLSGVVEGTAGYGLVFWGSPSGSPWYGYIRPKIDAASAVTYNSGALVLELFPISFLGVRAGGEAIQNDQEYSAYDCNEFRCEGRFHRTFFDAELSLGIGPLFTQGRWRRERWSQKEDQIGDFVDPTSGLLIFEEGESQTVYQVIAGYKFNSTWQILGGVRYAQTDYEASVLGSTNTALDLPETEMPSTSRFSFGMLRYTKNRLSVSLGGGVFESELKKQGAAAMGQLTWEIWPSVEVR